jgi:hypothetical protein
VGPLEQGATFEVVVTDRGGVPAIGVGAVAVNVTAVVPSTAGYLTVWPTGDERPNASNLNFVPGDVVPNLAVVRVGSGGRISIFNETGTTHLLVDVVGWFADNAGLQPLLPARLADTRGGARTIDGVFAGTGSLNADATASLPVSGRGGVPTSGVTAVVLNVTVTAPTAGGYITAWPSTADRPNASNLNFVPDQTVANLVITKVGPDGRVLLYNSSGNTHLIVDVMGWFGSDSELNSLQPARLHDSRPGAATIDGAFAATGPLGPGENRGTRSIPVSGRGGVPATGVDAVVLNVTVTSPTNAGFMTVWPTGFVRPTASSLNYTPGETVANLVIARVSGGWVSLYNSAGSAHLIVDVVGWMPPNQPLSFTQLNLQPGVAGQAYSGSIGLTGSQGPYAMTASGVAPGLALHPSGTFSGTPSTPGTSAMQLLASDRFGRPGFASLPHSVFPAASGFVSLAPTTVLNTFPETLSLGPDAVREFQVGGVGGVPATGVAPVLSVGAFGWQQGYMTFWPNGNPQPMSSHLNVGEFEVTTDLVVTPMGADGKVRVYTYGRVDVQVDVIGYLPLGGSFSPISPVRLADTRLSTPLGAGAQRDFTIAGAGGTPVGATDVLAIVVATGITTDGAFTIWDTGGTAPAAPSIRWDASSPTKAQFVIVHLSADGRTTVRNSAASATHVIIDVVAYFN